ncbi:MAG: 23S rRNA (uracil(1939)-C(5))-methyltransferase RlmD [Defluviitaleaceae bacterium]|nr:23S rRNA (uracil(1939)-C(5))-methyltransferase RlmD [Defluviitaleaceae bacterium]
MSTIDLEITNINGDGHGVGRADGFVFFVDGGLPGDFLSVEVIKTKKHYANCRILEVITPSKHRVAPPCPAFAPLRSLHSPTLPDAGYPSARQQSSRCGGCQLLHCDYASQLIFKKQIVVDAITRIGGIPKPPIADVVGMDNPLNYRNKGVFPVFFHENKGFIGMNEPRSDRLIPVDNCLLQHPAHKAILDAIRKYTNRQCRGIHRIMVRVGFMTGDVMAAISADSSVDAYADSITADLVSAGAATVLFSRSKTSGNQYIDDFHPTYGAGYITDYIGDLKFKISASSFFQVNPIQTKVLYDIALAQANLTGHENVIDAHCGVGSIALCASRRTNEVVGIDISASSIRDANTNAKINNITNARFICKPSDAAIPHLLTDNSVVILDPPRAGCETALLNALIATPPKRIVYISCDPGTLARDLKILTNSCFSLVDVRPVDMFPMTSKIEVSCLLERK